MPRADEAPPAAVDNILIDAANLRGIG